MAELGDIAMISDDSSAITSHSKLTLVKHIKNKDNYHAPTLIRPHSVTFLTSADIAITEGFWPYSRVQVFTSKNLYRTSFSIGQGDMLPYAITTCRDYDSSHQLTVTDHRDRTVKFIKGIPDQIQMKDTIESWKPGMFEWPTGIAIDLKESYYIADWSRGLVGVYDRYGHTIRTVETTGQPGGSCPVDVCVDSHERLIVSDGYDQSVKVFDNRGCYMFRFGDSEGRGRLVDPRGVCVDERGGQRILVADWGDRAVKMFDAEGRYIEDIVSEADGVIHPYGIAVSGEGYLAITEHRLRAPPAVKIYTF